MIINGGGIFIGASVSVTPAVLVSNGTSVTDQAGGFTDVGAAVGYAYVGGGVSTSSGTNSQGQGINTSMFMVGLGAGTPDVSFGQSNTTVITDPDLIRLYEAQFGDRDPFAAGSSVLAGGQP